MMEVTLVLQNAEPTTVVTESGRVRVVRWRQRKQNRAGIFGNCDGASNVTDNGLDHPIKTESPRVETEEGTVKEVGLLQIENA
jgi:hypothetical protein